MFTTNFVYYVENDGEKRHTAAPSGAQRARSFSKNIRNSATAAAADRVVIMAAANSTSKYEYSIVVIISMTTANYTGIDGYTNLSSLIESTAAPPRREVKITRDKIRYVGAQSTCGLRVKCSRRTLMHDGQFVNFAGKREI